MKEKATKIFRSSISLLLAACLMLGMCSNGLIALAADLRSADSGSEQPKGEINYVSIGDSMTNGYGFEGYEQGTTDRNKYDFLAGKNVYGEGAYPLQFEAYLKSKGYTVNHTKLAPSALLAEDLLFLLGGERPVDNGWSGYRDYVSGYSDEELAPFFQEAVINADVITLCIGNASFGAFLVDRITNVIGIMGGEATEYSQLTLENGLALLESEEAKQVVLDIYDEMKAELANYTGVIPADINVKAVLELIAYTAASFMVSYEKALDKIIELNPDVEIILIGLMNTTYGMTISGGDFVLPFGDMMDTVFESLNTYIAAVPTAKQLAGEYKEATFLYAEQPAPEFICQEFENLLDNDWVAEDSRLDGAIVRQRNIDAFNGMLAGVIGQAINGAPLAKITLADIEAYENIDWNLMAAYEINPWGGFEFSGYDCGDRNPQAVIMSVAIYLAIEEAVARNTNTMDIPLEGLMAIAGDISTVFGGLGTPPTAAPEATRTWLYSGFMNSDVFCGMCKVYGLFKVGNGMSVHPTPAGHDGIFEAVKYAYENEYIAAQKVLDTAIELISEFYDEAYAYGYQYALENGYINVTVDAIDEAIAAIEAIDLSVAGMTAELEAEVAAELAAIVETLEAAKALILEADVLDQASLEALLAMLNEAAEAAEALLPVLNQAGVDVNNLVIIPAINAAIEHIETVVIPAAIEAAEIIAKKANEQIIIALGNAYDYLVNAMVTALPQIDEALYNYLYNNPEEVIAFFATYGPCMVELMGEYGGEVLAVVAYALYTYGPDLAAYVIENPEVILANLSAWADKYGDRTVALLQVYAEALGLCDAVRDQIAELEKTVEELENELNAKIEAIEKEIAELKAQLETAVGEAKAEIEAKIAALEAELAALKAEIEAKIAEVKAAIAELKAALEAAIESGLTKIEELKAAIENLDEKVAELIEAAKKAALDQVNGAIKNLENAIAKLDEAVYALAGEAYENLKAALKELANELAAQIAEAAKKYFPELADAIYNYLYNNPEEVIDFVKTYGPYFGEIVAEYGDEALAVIGYILYMYGEDMAAYVVENHEEILSALVAWFDVHGENTAALLQVYAEALGWCDAVREQIAELEATLNELYAALENATGAAKEAIQEEIAKVEAAIAELKAELEALIEKINAIIADVNATVEEAIARVEAAIAELKATVAAVKAAVKEAIETAKQALEDAIIHQLEIVLNKQLENLEEAVEALEEAVMAAVAELKAIVDQLVYDATHAEYVIDMESYYLAIGSDPEFAKLLAQALDMEKNYGVTDWDNVDLESILKADLITLSYNENQLSNFAFNQAFGYVADYVNVEFRNSLVAYVVETMKEVLPKMLPALSDAAINKYVAIISAQINGTIDQYSAEYFGDATASEMDWATIVGSNNVCYVDDARDEMKEAFIDAGVPETYAYQIPVLDYLYENLEMLGELGELMAMFDKEIVYEMFGERAMYTMEIPVVDALTFAGESYAFGYAQFNIQYAETVLTINKINPDAIVVLLGHYNAFQSIELEVNGTSINLGDIYGDFANVTSAHSFVYALLQENTIYVDISDAETVFGAYGAESETSVLDFVDAYLSDSTITSVSAAGHEYIKEQILNALTVIDTRGVIGDADGDGDVDSTDAMLVLQYDAMIIGKDELNLILCDVDGDGDVDSTDAMYILQFDGLLIEEFPVEE